MTTTRTKYHHGDLRRSAILAAKNRINNSGVDSVSVRSLASEIGVAHRAIYNHFSDKGALLSAVAATGYQELAQALTVTTEPAQHMRAYANYALANRHLYTVMMNLSYEQFESDPELRAGADSVIAASIDVLAPKTGSENEKRRAVMRHWMLIHGGLSLHSSGVLMARSDESFIEEMLTIANLGPNRDEESQPLWSTVKEPNNDN